MKGGKYMSKWVCSICGYVYDENKEGISFENLPENWTCPLCGAAKDAFSKENPSVAKSPAAPINIDGDMRELSAGELSAVCSNLARGCEKQYKDREAALFHQLADFFLDATPPVQDSSIYKLIELLNKDLNEGYPALRGAADSESDRGTLRICVWGEKVTRILSSLLSRYLKEGEAFLSDTQVWICTVCGFVYVGDKSPELCPVCKVPAWKFEKVEGRR
jgi:NADP-reducing hydrogenase subunit HndD